MAGFAQIVTLAALVISQAEGAPCLDCVDDGTALLQVNTVVNHGAHSDDEKETEPVGSVEEVDMVSDIATGKEEQDPGVESMKDAMMAPDRMSKEEMDMGEQAYHLRSPIPPPVGHGEVSANPKVVTDMAVASTMPGPHDGAINKAYENSKARASAETQEAADEGMDLAMEDQKLNDDVAEEVAKQDKNLADTMKAQDQSVLNSYHNIHSTEKAAIDEVAAADREAQEAAVVKTAAENAAIVGQEVGERSGVENAAAERQQKLNDMVENKLNQERKAMEEADMQAKEEGITERQRAKQAMRDQAAAYLHHREKGMEAAEADSAADAALERADIVGPQYVEEHMIMEDAHNKADSLRKMAAHDMAATDDAANEGAAAAVYHMKADTVAPVSYR